MPGSELPRSSTLPGSVWDWSDPSLVALLEHLRSGRPVRYEDVERSLAGAPVEAGQSAGIGSAAGAPIVVGGEACGHIGLAMAKGRPLPDGVVEQLAELTELVATVIANNMTREQVERLADEQAALRRVVTLVARGAPPAGVFDTVAEEVGRLLDVGSSGVVRFEDEQSARVVAGWGRLGEVAAIGARLPIGGHNVISEIARTGSPARIDDVEGTGSGPIAERARRLSTGTSIGGPIVVAGRVWGAMVVAALEGGSLPADAQSRLEQFVELVGMAIANAEARVELGRLADEQAALRRVATLVAEAPPPPEVFDAVIVEVARLLDAGLVGLMRVEGPDEVTIVANRGHDPKLIRPGLRMPVAGDSVIARVLRTGRSSRIDLSREGVGHIADLARRVMVSGGQTVGAPVTVEGRLWGVMSATWAGEHRPPGDAEERLAGFAQLLGTAIANADSRDQLTASRARVLTAGDDARRRVVDDLHDGAQQRLVHTIVTLKLAQRALARQDERLPALLSEALGHAEEGNTELRELAHGILPAVLTRGGLRSGVAAVVARLDLPVRTDVTTRRLPPEVEASAYFIVAEALTNAVKHAQATRAEVTATVSDDRLLLVVRDDGIGGAEPEGHGLLGIRDRVAASGGRLRIDSPRGGGTVLAAELPLEAG